jgi:hypothetical protein
MIFRKPVRGLRGRLGPRRRVLRELLVSAGMLWPWRVARNPERERPEWQQHGGEHRSDGKMEKHAETAMGKKESIHKPFGSGKLKWHRAE